MPATELLQSCSPLDNQVLQFEQLQILSGKKRLTQVERWARTQGIAYKYDAKGGIWTTVDALNNALGLYIRADLPYPPDMVL